jgi:hypothetical protein
MQKHVHMLKKGGMRLEELEVVQPRVFAQSTRTSLADNNAKQFMHKKMLESIMSKRTVRK